MGTDRYLEMRTTADGLSELCLAGPAADGKLE